MSDPVLKLFDVVQIMEYAADWKKLEMGTPSPEGRHMGGRTVSCVHFSDLVNIGGREWSLKIWVDEWKSNLVWYRERSSVLDYRKEPLDEHEKRLDYMIEPANDSDGRNLFYAFGRVLYVNRVDIEGNPESFWNDWVIFKMYDHLWRRR